MQLVGQAGTQADGQSEAAHYHQVTMATHQLLTITGTAVKSQAVTRRTRRTQNVTSRVHVALSAVVGTHCKYTRTR